jgi:hypothetical protein
MTNSNSDGKPDEPERSALLRKAISRWDNEGGAGPGHPGLAPGDVPADVPALTNAELVQLQVRVIALENLVIALLADASKRQLDLAGEMAVYIFPRPGYTPHSLTIHAAAQIAHVVERSHHFRTVDPTS